MTLLMTICAFAELVSIGSLFPFLVAISSPDKILNSDFFLPIIKYFNISSEIVLIRFSSIVFMLAIFISGILKFLQIFYLSKISASLTSDISTNVFSKVMFEPYSSHLMTNSNEYIARILEKSNAVVYHGIRPILQISQGLIIFIFFSIFLVIVNPFSILLTILILILLYLIIVIIFNNLTKNYSKQLNILRPQVLKNISESVGGIKETIIRNDQKLYINIYRALITKFRTIQEQINILAETPRVVVETLGIMLLMSIILLIGVSQSGFLELIPFIGSLAFAIQRLLPTLNICYSQYILYKSDQHSVGEVLSYLSIKGDQSIKNENYDQVKGNIIFRDSISLENILFRFNENEPYIFKDLNLRIFKGDVIGIIGETGSGKTTLINFIMGLLLPNLGIIKIDGKKLENLNLSSWQKKISHVPQSIFISDSTLAENIAFGIPKGEIDLAKVKTVCEIVCLSDVVENWKDKYHTIVGENGMRTSGGQKQRIGIARALYRGCEVLILDEATSALDQKTEDLILENINKSLNKITLIMIAHRLKSLKKCSRIIEVNNQHISEIFDHKILLK
tara:strand:+ start:154 stop:1851 length:1698 start_codon:yes stop_codon:yes gene_type:complete